MAKNARTGIILERGFGLVEVLIGVAIIVGATIGAGAAIGFYVKIGLKQTEKVQAAYLAEEGLEAVRFLRDAGFSTEIETLLVDQVYYLATTTTGWEATTSPVLIDNTFLRTLTFEEVWRRDSDKDIVASTSPDAKTVDESARRAVISVGSREGTTTIATYLVDLFNN